MLLAGTPFANGESYIDPGYPAPKTWDRNVGEGKTDQSIFAEQIQSDRILGNLVRTKVWVQCCGGESALSEMYIDNW